MEPQTQRQIDWAFIASGLVAIFATVIFVLKVPLVPMVELIFKAVKTSYTETFGRPNIPTEELGSHILKFNNPENVAVGFDKSDHLTEFPIELTELTQLQVLEIEDAEISILPFEIGNLVNLEVLTIKRSGLETLPSSIGNLVKLRELDLSGNNLFTLPAEITNLILLQKLNLRDNPLSAEEIETLKAAFPSTEIVY